MLSLLYLQWRPQAPTHPSAEEPESEDASRETSEETDEGGEEGAALARGDDDYVDVPGGERGYTRRKGKRRPGRPRKLPDASPKVLGYDHFLNVNP